MVDAQTIGVLVTAASVTVAAIYYIMTLKTQQRNMKQTLETRKLQFVTSSLQNYLNEEGMRRYAEVMNMEWRDYDDFEKKYGSDFNIDNYAKRSALMFYYNMCGTFLREKLIDPESLYNLGMWGACFFWVKFKGIIEEQRRLYNGADWGQDIELLATEMMRIKLRKDPSYKVPETFLRYISNK